MRLTTIYSKVRLLISQPNEEWLKIKEEDTPYRVLLKGYVLPLIILFIGSSVLGRVLFTDKIELTFLIRIIYVVKDALIPFIGIYVSSLIINEIVPRFSNVKNLNRTFQLMGYSFTPYLLTLFIKGLLANYSSLNNFLSFFSLYGFYLMWIGCPVILDIRKEDKINFILLSGLVIIGVFTLMTYSADFVFNIILITSAVKAM